MAALREREAKVKRRGTYSNLVTQSFFESGFCQSLLTLSQKVGQAELLDVLIVVFSHGAKRYATMILDHFSTAVKAKHIAGKLRKVSHAELCPGGNSCWPWVQEPTHVKGHKRHCSCHVGRWVPIPVDISIIQARLGLKGTYAVCDTWSRVTSAR
jgi:hypothetical protein